MTLTAYLIVKDMAVSLAFYKAYFGKEPFGGCPERFAIFGVGNTSLALYNPQYDEQLIKSCSDINKHFNDAYLHSGLGSTNNPVAYGSNVVLNIGVDDLTVEYERVKSLDIGKVSKIMYVNIAMPYYFFNIADPDGNYLEITGGYKNEHE